MTLSMKNLYLFHIIFILLISHAITFSQNGIYLDAGPGYAYLANKDKAMSPLIYSGSSVFSKISFLDINEKRRHGLDGTFSYGKLTSETGYEASAIRYSVDYSPVWRITRDTSSKLWLFAGGTWYTFQTMKFNSHYTNNYFYSDFVTSLGPAAILTYPFRIFKRHTVIDFSLQFPLFNWIVRPGYATTSLPGSLENEDSYFKDFISSGKVQSLNKYQQITSKLGLSWYLKNGNAIKFQYMFDFYHYNDLNETSFLSHSLALSTSFSFTKQTK